MTRRYAPLLFYKQVILHPSAFILARGRSPVIGHARPLLAAALCLLLAGCGTFQFGASNSPDWCPSRDSKGCL
jgi:hypothetical protein